MFKQILNQVLGRKEDEHSIAYSKIVDRIIELLENNLEEWKIEWNHHNGSTRLDELHHPNGLILWMFWNSVTIKLYEHRGGFKTLDCKNKKKRKQLIKTVRKIEALLKKQEIESWNRKQAETQRKILQKISDKLDVS